MGKPAEELEYEDAVARISEAAQSARGETSGSTTTEASSSSADTPPPVPPAAPAAESETGGEK